MGTSKILLKNNLPENIKSYLEIINKNSQTILKMANDFLNIALFDSGKVKLDVNSVKLSDLISDAVTTFNIICKTKNINLVIGEIVDTY